MTRFCVIILLLFAVVYPLATNAQNRETVEVTYDDGRSAEEINAWRMDTESDALYLRANDVARIFRATQFWNASNRKVVFGIEGKRFTLTVDTRVVVVDGEPVMMRAPALYDAGFVMVPMEFVLDIAASYTPSVFDWDDVANALRVKKVGYNVRRLVFATTDKRSTATIELDEPLIHHLDTSTPGLVRLKLYGGRVDPAHFDVRDEHGLFNGVRAEQTDRDAYVYFDVKRTAARIFIEQEEKTKPRLQLVLETGDLPEIPDPDFVDNRQIEVIEGRTTTRRELAIRRVVLDAGHGGKDYGKIGISGVLEKDVNLSIARQTRDRLQRELDVEVLLTREDDRLLSLTRRTEIANEAKGDLFISIHCNSWFSPETGGFEAYFLSAGRTEMDRAIARFENAADAVTTGAQPVTSDIGFILWDMVQNEYINESSYFAELTQKSMNARLSIRNRGVKQANFHVLQGARMPAVLIETAFLSNASEESMLADPTFQRKIADGIVEAVRKFKERYE